MQTTRPPPAITRRLVFALAAARTARQHTPARLRDLAAEVLDSARAASLSCVADAAVAFVEAVEAHSEALAPFAPIPKEARTEIDDALRGVVATFQAVPIEIDELLREVTPYHIATESLGANAGDRVLILADEEGDVIARLPLQGGIGATEEVEAELIKRSGLPPEDFEPNRKTFPCVIAWL